jgi:hypothetical protein
MLIRIGYELLYDCPQPTPMLLMLNVHYIPHRAIGSCVSQGLKSIRSGTPGPVLQQ